MSVAAIVTEKEIVKGCKRRTRDAQGALYALTCDAVFRLLLRMTRNREDAADLMQETYVKVFDRIDQFREASAVATWTFRIAVNEALQHSRRQRQQRRVIEESKRSEPLNQNQLRVDLQDALDQLPELERTLIVLKYYGDLGYSQMAEALKMPAGTIASGLNRARKMLRDLLADGAKS